MDYTDFLEKNNNNVVPPKKVEIDEVIVDNEYLTYMNNHFENYKPFQPSEENNNNDVKEEEEKKDEESAEDKRRKEDEEEEKKKEESENYYDKWRQKNPIQTPMVKKRYSIFSLVDFKSMIQFENEQNLHLILGNILFNPINSSLGKEMVIKIVSLELDQRRKKSAEMYSDSLSPLSPLSKKRKKENGRKNNFFFSASPSSPEDRKNPHTKNKKQNKASNSSPNIILNLKNENCFIEKNIVADSLISNFQSNPNPNSSFVDIPISSLQQQQQQQKKNIIQQLPQSVQQQQQPSEQKCGIF